MLGNTKETWFKPTIAVKSSLLPSLYLVVVVLVVVVVVVVMTDYWMLRVSSS